MGNYAGRVGVIVLLFALLQSAPDPGLQARWASSISAVVSWRQTERACLYRNTTFVDCYDAPGDYRVELGGPLTDGTLRPAAGDVYSLWQDGEITNTRLMGRVFVPVVQR